MSGGHDISLLGGQIVIPAYISLPLPADPEVAGSVFALADAILALANGDAA